MTSGPARHPDREKHEARARDHNDAAEWDRIWEKEGVTSWRGRKLANVYTRIRDIIFDGASIVDFGGGVGQLADFVIAEKPNCEIQIRDHSMTALNVAGDRHMTIHVDLETETGPPLTDKHVAVSTETLEHLSEKTRHRLFAEMSKAAGAFVSVPNDELHPDQEHQHATCYSALTFLHDLRQHWGDRCRVECIDDYLLGICGGAKSYKLSVCFPARDEAADVERVLRSFRGVADEIVVGVDPRTTDNTRAIAEKYAEVVFDLTEPEGPAADRVPEGGVHFAWIRNQCMDRCTGDWTFMTEAHEELKEGQDLLLNLDHLLEETCGVVMVTRTGMGQQWAYPWLCRNQDRFRYERATHNALGYPEGTKIQVLPAIKTFHFRDHRNAVKRRGQRKIQNRLSLMDDWVTNRNEHSLFYLGQEWREYDPQRAVKYFSKAIVMNTSNGPCRYQARLELAKQYAKLEETREARAALIPASGDDWSRIEHFVWLGDIAWSEQQSAQALHWYSLAAVRYRDPPLTTFWVDQHTYGIKLAQRMTTALCAVGRLEAAVQWMHSLIEDIEGAEDLGSNHKQHLRGEAKANLERLTRAMETSC